MFVENLYYICTIYINKLKLYEVCMGIERFYC